MSKKTDDLLAQAKSLNDDNLTDAIEALDFLGGEATANHQEFKDLEKLMSSKPKVEEPTIDEIESEIVEQKLNEQTAEQTAKQNDEQTVAETAETIEAVDKIAEDAKEAATKASQAAQAVDAVISDKLEEGEEQIASKQGIEPEDVSLDSHSLTRKPIDPVFAKKVTKLPYAGIKMIGNMFYSKKDGYAVGFASADECSEHYNQ